MGIGPRRAYTMAVLMLPILSQYQCGIPKLTLGDLALCLAILAVTAYYGFRRHPIRIDTRSITTHPAFWLAIWVVCGSMLSSLTQDYIAISEMLGSSMRFIFYLFCAYMVSTAFFDVEYFMERYRILVILATAFIIMQTLLFYWNGDVLFGTIPGLKVANPHYDQDAIRRSCSDFYRPASIFLEPGYYAQFVLPYLAYTLFSKNRRRKYIEAIVLTGTCILSTSGQGIIISLVVWTLHFATSAFNYRKHAVNLRILTVSIIMIAMALSITRTSMMQRSWQRLFGAPTASSHSRILRGFEIYRQLEPVHKAIGIGYGHKETRMSHTIIATQYWGDEIFGGYMNSIAGMLVSLGLIGFLLMLRIFIFLWSNSCGYRRVCTCILILLSAAGAYFTGPSMVFCVSIILSGRVRSDAFSRTNMIDEELLRCSHRSAYDTFYEDDEHSW